MFVFLYVMSYISIIYKHSADYVMHRCDIPQVTANKLPFVFRLNIVVSTGVLGGSKAPKSQTP